MLASDIFLRYKVSIPRKGNIKLAHTNVFLYNIVKMLEVIDVMPFVDKMLGLLIGVIVCAIFGGIIYVLAKKHNELTKELINGLTDEQKEKLMNTSLENNVLTKGLIAVEPKVGNSKTQLKVLVYNMYYPNCMKEFILADVSISTKQHNEYNLKQGDYITISLDENGAKAVF